jgi:hypothetical protein
MPIENNASVERTPDMPGSASIALQNDISPRDNTTFFAAKQQPVGSSDQQSTVLPAMDLVDDRKSERASGQGTDRRLVPGAGNRDTDEQHYSVGHWILGEMATPRNHEAWKTATTNLDGRLDRLADRNPELSAKEREGLKTLQDGLLKGSITTISKLLTSGNFSRDELEHIATAFNLSMKDLNLDGIAQMSISEKEDAFGNKASTMIGITSPQDKTTVEIYKSGTGKAEGKLAEEKPPFEPPGVGIPGRHEDTSWKTKYPHMPLHAISVIADKMISANSGEPLPRRSVTRLWLTF